MIFETRTAGLHRSPSRFRLSSRLKSLNTSAGRPSANSTNRRHSSRCSGSTAAETAYTIELGPDHSVDVLLHQGRLMWPLRYATPLRDPVSDDDAVSGPTFQMLQDGTLDLFSDGKLAATAGVLADDDLWRKVIRHGEEDALSRINHNIARCLLLGNELLAEGGVPIYVTRNRELAPTVRVASTAPAEAAIPSVDGLAIQPGGFHLRSLQDSLSRGLFRFPSVGDKAPPPNGGYPRIIAHKTDFRRCDRPSCGCDVPDALAGAEPQTDQKGDETWKWAHTRFKDAISSTLPDLTVRRCEALHEILANFRLAGRTRDNLDLL